MVNETVQREEPQERLRPQAGSLLDAALRLAAVMRYGGLSLAETAARIESYDSEPYPLTYVLLSSHIVLFLRALDAADTMLAAGRMIPEAQVALGRPSYGPPLREVSP